jgi:CRP/FNR family transcriptional regulator, cyclic AMP receptor protein
MPSGEAASASPASHAVLRRALDGSHLRSLSEDVVGDLLRDAVRLRVPPGSHLRREGDPGPHVELVLEGLVRVFVSAPDGRTLTIRYCRPGAIIGAVSLFRPGYAMPGGVQALVDSEVLALRAPVVQALAATELTMARALLDELAERVHQFGLELPGSAFGSIRQRVARHLLDLASESQRGEALVAAVSQQALAEAVGSVREVVVRALGELRRDGLIETGRVGIRIVDPDRLAAEAQAPG